MTDRTADAGLDRFEFAIGFVMLALDRFTQRGIFHLGDFFFVAAGCDCAPRRARVVKVPMFEREREAGAKRRGLPEDRQPLLAASLEPREAALMNLGVAPRGRDRVVQDRAIRLGREPLEEREVVLDMSGRLRDLDEAI